METKKTTTFEAYKEIAGLRFLCVVFFLSIAPQHAFAQIDLPETPAPTEVIDPEPVIDPENAPPQDVEIRDRIAGIFAELESLKSVAVRVDSGVVTLTGEVGALEDAERAKSIAARVSGVVTVESQIERNLDVADNLEPITEKLQTNLQKFLSSLPLIGIALLVFIAFWMIGSFLSRRAGLWRRIAPNMFLAELMGVTVKLVLIIAGLVIALDILQATALMGAILGSAGLLGLAIGFAIRDTVENYISSIMLSIRQPFRANDHVIIGDREGHVIRLTSRATILMTLDGNHLRIPNSTVFKAEILNYSTNPERRFEFELGVDADDDPAAAITTGLKSLRALDFVLDVPKASARLEQVGDSNLVIRYLAWIDQTHTDYFKARTTAIREVMFALEDGGFALPEPIYRLRFDSGAPLEIARAVKSDPKEEPTKVTKNHGQSAVADHDVSREDDITKKVATERAVTDDQDILDNDRPVE